jgi:hypothetical protein
MVVVKEISQSHIAGGRIVNTVQWAIAFLKVTEVAVTKPLKIHNG